MAFQAAGHGSVDMIDELAPQLDATANPLQQRQALEQAIGQACKSLHGRRESVTRWFAQQKIQGNVIFDDPEWFFRASPEALAKELATATSQGNPIDGNRATALTSAFFKHREANEKAFVAGIANFGRLADALIGKTKPVGHSVLAITDAAIEQEMPLVITAGQFLQFRLAEWFAAYHHAFEFNKYWRYRAEHEGDKNVHWLSDEDFSQRYGPPPWNIVNSIFGRAGFPYLVNQPSGSAESHFNLRLIDPFNNALNLRIADLSSGERIMLSIALLLYQTESRIQLAAIPKVLLLDEIDAPLHPTFTRVLLETLKNTLVDRHDLKVIMATHSPSTVALAPPESVFELVREPRKLRQTSPSEACQILSSGFVSITTTDVIVITESRADPEYYSEVYGSLVRGGQLPPRPALKFIAASRKEKDEQGGGSGQVHNWAPKLQELGLERFRGLVDSDQGQSETAVIKVLSRLQHRKLYLRPAYFDSVFGAQWHRRYLAGIGIERQNVAELLKLADRNLEQAVDQFCDWLSKQSGETGIWGSSKVAANYLGRSIQISKWWIDVKGHDLETLLQKFLNPLAKKHRRSALVKSDRRALIEFQTKAFPELVPADFVSIFDRLQRLER